MQLCAPTRTHGGSMAWLGKRAAIAASFAAALMLAGCFEISSDTVVKENGEATVSVEFAMAAELIAFMENPAFSNKEDGNRPPDFLKDCGKPPSQDEPLPPGVRSFDQKRGMRAGMATCTMIIDLSDPILAFENAKKIEMARPDKAPAPDFTLTRLDGQSGYQVRGKITLPSSPVPSGSPEAEKMGQALMIAMLGNRFVTVSITGQRIENANGEVSPDGRKVTWKIPLIALVSPNPAFPLEFNADVIYAEGMLAKWKRKLLE